MGRGPDRSDYRAKVSGLKTTTSTRQATGLKVDGGKGGLV